MIKINLVPSDLLDKARQRQQTLQVAAVAVVFAVGVAGLSAVHLFKAQRLESELVTVKAEMKRWQEKLDKLNDLQRKTDEVKARIKVISDLRTGRPLYPLFMSDFVRAVPPGVWVKSLQVSNLPNLSLKLNISADSSTSEDIMGWIKNMADGGKFSVMEMGGVSVAVNVDGTKSYSFTLTGTYASKL